MHSIAKTSQRGNAFSLVLNDNGADLFKSTHHVKHVFQVASLPLIYVAVAYHNRDLNELGNGKTPHYHVVIHLSQRLSVGSMVKLVCELFQANENQVSCEKCNDVGAQSRYLCHLDDLDKYQYDLSIVDAWPVQTFEEYVERGIKVHDIEDLIRIVEQNPSTKRLMLLLGAKQYKDWRVYIQDLLRGY